MAKDLVTDGGDNDNEADDNDDDDYNDNDDDDYNDDDKQYVMCMMLYSPGWPRILSPNASPTSIHHPKPPHRHYF